MVRPAVTTIEPAQTHGSRQKKAKRLSLAFSWRLLKDVLKRLSILVFMYIKLISHPHLYPQFAFDTPVEEYLYCRVGKILRMAEKRI